MPAIWSDLDHAEYGYNRRRTPGDYPDPFVSPAKAAMPRLIEHRLKFTERLFLQNAIYASALMRKALFGIGAIEVKCEGEDQDQSQITKAKEFLTTVLGSRSSWRRGILANLVQFYMDMASYHNSFSTTDILFERLMTCPGCGFTISSQKFCEPGNPFHFRFQINARLRGEWAPFHGTCISCKTSGPWDWQDNVHKKTDQIYIRHWPATEMRPVYNQSHDLVIGYYWVIPGTLREAVRKGDWNEVAFARRDILEAVRDNHDIYFDKDIIFHAADPAPSGVKTMGWGIGLPGSEYEAYLLEVMKRANLSVSQSLIAPLKVMMPSPRSTGAGAPTASMDAMATFSGGEVAETMLRMAEDHKLDPDDTYVSAYPIEFLMMGGNANQLAPVPLLDNQYQTMLGGLGVPVELFNMSFQTQATETSLRLFEAVNAPSFANQDAFVSFHFQNSCRILSWPPMLASVKRPSYYDTVDKQQLIAQLQQAGLLPERIVTDSVGEDWEQAQREIVSEQVRKQEISAVEAEKLRKKDEFGQYFQMPAVPGSAMPQDPNAQGGQGGAPAQGGAQAPMGGQEAGFAASSPAPPQSIPDMERLAESLAMQGMAARQSDPRTGGAASKRFLASIEQRYGEQGSTLKRIVQGMMDEMGDQAASQGKQQVLQQQFGGQQGGA
jgi:hypothetical protein